jgi:hypothetical protein
MYKKLFLVTFIKDERRMYLPYLLQLGQGLERQRGLELEQVLPTHGHEGNNSGKPKRNSL